MTVEIHKRGAHVPIWGILKEDGVLASPSVSCTVTVTDPEEALVAEDEVMTESETGIYYYQLPTDSDFELGWYICHHFNRRFSSDNLNADWRLQARGVK